MRKSMISAIAATIIMLSPMLCARLIVVRVLHNKLLLLQIVLQGSYVGCLELLMIRRVRLVHIVRLLLRNCLLLGLFVLRSLQQV